MIRLCSKASAGGAYRPLARWRVIAALLLLLCLGGAGAAQDDRWLGPPEAVSDGITLFKVNDPGLLSPEGPVAVQLLKLDPRRVELRSVLARDQVMGVETVLSMSTRLGALAAVNAGFFEPSGEPAGLMKVGGELVSDMARSRGAVAIQSDGRGEPVRLLFDRVTARVSIRFRMGGQGRHTVPVAGVDTTRQIGRLMLYTPRYYEHTDTAPTGTEWVLRGSPLKVVERRVRAGHTPIPRDGAVLSFGGLEPSGPLSELDTGGVVEIVEEFATGLGTRPHEWAKAPQVVGGAGLLFFESRMITDWAPEQMRAGFTTERHPRTIIGVGRDRAIWLVTIDGRQPELSLGMTFAELQALGRRLGLRGALNLDGGGSTTMVVRDRIVNSPSDPVGPRPVSDALLVFSKNH